MIVIHFLISFIKLCSVACIYIYETKNKICSVRYKDIFMEPKILIPFILKEIYTNIDIYVKMQCQNLSVLFVLT